MKQHAQQQHKPPAEPADQKGMQKGNRHTEQSQAHGGTKDSSEADRALRSPRQHSTDQSIKRAAHAPAEDGRAAAQEGQMPQNQQRLGQHQNSRKQP
ncbi:hypothetical protein [Ralstonia mannitolilytica]|uniref:Uncharacterized protein n=1 Tax=Ralstonia mannitolilytica TaxID=105219 RepID=A0AAD2AMQ8_9RALS|nr:hypothetical protein [Ralstonia mannitolilytica]MBY4717809.1 hypothetical protein [Ralstonia mannitolilytica]CAJ0683491.1 hypothetical protein R77591_02308 [Ralstonia mannitolilytica]CAJ0691067.1 hypothetical protein LMG18102_01387 [Ralstonia mannitolilytica]CAJ0709089.1 hypothetical protein LMG8323_00501 [Ralstonia mannitolilytica]CAJ0867700.1 hypothetical protein R1479_01446 [Ralstonia mannitolilytica]